MPGESNKIGGEYGDVRAPFDVERLNTYFNNQVPAIKTPVDVKQFKVGLTLDPVCVHRRIDEIIQTVWTGELLLLLSFCFG